MLTKFIEAVRNREGKIPSVIHAFAKKVLWFNVPAIKGVYLPLFAVYSFVQRVLNYILQKFFFEPMFKVNCVKVGKNFRIHKNIPYFTANLQMEFGDNVGIDGKNTFIASSVLKNPRLCVGDNAYIGYGTTISVGKEITIGKDCLIANGVFICDNNGHPVAPARRHEKVREDEISPVTIGNNVWICNNAFVGQGVTIGNGAIVAAHSVVVRDVAPNTIVSGIPAKVVKEI